MYDNLLIYYKLLLSYKDFKIDFSQIDLNRAELKRDSVGLPDNIGVAGPIITDTSPMDIIDALRQALRHEVVVIDLHEGNAWWVTRLLALAAGAVRAQAPKVFVFAGRLENQDHRFLQNLQAESLTVQARFQWLDNPNQPTIVCRTSDE